VKTFVGLVHSRLCASSPSVTIPSPGIKSSAKSQQAYLNPQHFADAGLISALSETGTHPRVLALELRFRGRKVVREGGSSIRLEAISGTWRTA
jgi:hypothetical protein